MRTLLYCLLSYTFTLCHVAQADSSNVTIDLLRYDLFDEGRTARVLGLRLMEKTITNLFIPDRVLHETKTYTVYAAWATAAFANKGLLSVRLPTTLKSIGFGAFPLNSLTTVTIPDSVTSIGQAAFIENDISSLTLGTGLTSIGELAFGTNDLTTVTIPDSVTSIGVDAFS